MPERKHAAAAGEVLAHLTMALKNTQPRETKAYGLFDSLSGACVLRITAATKVEAGVRESGTERIK